MVDKLNIIEDIEVEYKKLYNECKKKYSTTRDVTNFLLNYYLGNRVEFESASKPQNIAN